MYAHDPQLPHVNAMKPVWIVDDDRSIRWVLEKALAREGIAYQSFSSAYEVLQALASSEPARSASGAPFGRTASSTPSSTASTTACGAAARSASVVASSSAVAPIGRRASPSDQLID